jgi:hypothetical protein
MNWQMLEKDENRLVLSFLGDVTCDRPMLKAARRPDGHFDFDRSLAELQPLLADSDCNFVY